MSSFLIFIFLVAIIVWLVMNGLNERRWVKAHSHDEEVAADKGIIPSKDDLINTREKIKETSRTAFQEGGALDQAKQKARDSIKEDGVLGKAKQKAQDSMKEGGVLDKAKQKAQDSMKEGGVLDKAKQKAQDSVKEGGVLDKAKHKAQDAMKEDGVLGKAKQKIQDGGYVEKAKDLSKGAGGKLKEAGSAARSRVDDIRTK